MRKIVILIVIVLGIAVISIGSFLSPDDLGDCGLNPTEQAGCEKADAIVAVSGGNTSTRSAAAIKLYQDGWADYLIFSGAAKDTSGPSNAAVMRKQAIDAGVPASAIITDDTSQTTHQNAEKAAEFIPSHDIKRLIVVTSPYHQRRASLEFKNRLGPSVTIVNHPAENDSDWPWYWWATPRGWWLAGGELIKITAVHAGESK